MQTLGRKRAGGLKQVEKPEPSASDREPAPGWRDLFKGLLALHVARSAQRVRERQAQLPPRAVPAARPVPAAPLPPKTVHELADERASEIELQPVPTRPFDIAKLVFAEFGRDNGTLMAAAVAFYLLLSIIPLMLMGVSMLGFFLNPDRAVQQTFTFLNQFLPIGKSTIRPVIEGVIKARGELGIAGLIGIALTATGGFATLENAVNVMWSQPNRNFIWNKIYAFGMMLVVGVGLGLSMAVSWSVALAGRLPGLQWMTDSWVVQIIGHVLPVAISALMFAVIYRFYPNGQSSWHSSLRSGFIVAVLWEAFKIGYAFYASRDTSPYGVFIGLVMWIFYSCTLLLMGSELTWVLEGCPGREGKAVVHAERNRQRKPDEDV